ncbi:hypothetical protein ACYPKM_03935 [Pseudomonas aeruginosa]
MTSAIIRSTDAHGAEILAAQNGGPAVLGLQLARIAANVLSTEPEEVARLNDGLTGLPLRACSPDQLTAMMMGMLFAHWDEPYEIPVRHGHAPVLRFSHHQFSVRPVTDGKSANFIYEVEFRPYIGVFKGRECPDRVWIRMTGVDEPYVFEGWPEEFESFCLKAKSLLDE